MPSRFSEVGYQSKQWEIRIVGVLVAAFMLADCAYYRRPYTGAPRRIYHTVKAGQTVAQIAYAYRLSKEALLKANGLSDISRVKVGAKLYIPGATYQRRVPAYRKPLKYAFKEPIKKALRLSSKSSVAQPTPLSKQPTVSSKSGAKSPASLEKKQRGMTSRPMLRPNQQHRMYASRLRTIPKPIDKKKRAPLVVAKAKAPDKPRPLIRKNLPKMPIRSGVRKGTMIWPVKGEISSEFGMRNGRMHKGIDIRARSGQEVYAVDDGVVIYSGNKLRGYGNLVLIKHGSRMATVYGHNKVNLVKTGDTVKKGQLIATVGRTGRASGYHLHFELRVDKKAVDPLEYLPKRSVMVSKR